MSGHNRKLRQAIFFEKDGDLNMSQALIVLVSIVGMIGFLATVVFFRDESIVVKITAWSFLGAVFTSLLIGSLPIAKAKILSQSKLPSEVSSILAGITDNIETSTDLKEITEKQQPPTNPI